MHCTIDQRKKASLEGLITGQEPKSKNRCEPVAVGSGKSKLGTGTTLRRHILIGSRPEEHPCCDGKAFRLMKSGCMLHDGAGGPSNNRHLGHRFEKTLKAPCHHIGQGRKQSQASQHVREIFLAVVLRSLPISRLLPADSMFGKWLLINSSTW